MKAVQTMSNTSISFCYTICSLICTQCYISNFSGRSSNVIIVPFKTIFMIYSFCNV